MAVAGSFAVAALGNLTSSSAVAGAASAVASAASAASIRIVLCMPAILPASPGERYCPARQWRPCSRLRLNTQLCRVQPLAAPGLAGADNEGRHARPQGTCGGDRHGERQPLGTVRCKACGARLGSRASSAKARGQGSTSASEARGSLLPRMPPDGFLLQVLVLDDHLDFMAVGRTGFFDGGGDGVVARLERR